MSAYEDILHLSRPVSPRHARMPLSDRAAQFSSFAALTGYEEVIEETGRLTDSCAELTESALAKIDRKLLALSERIALHPTVTVIYFHPDARKEGGSYQTKTGSLKAIDATFRRLLFTDRTELPFDSIMHITVT